jgi:hypothetical protein
MRCVRLAGQGGSHLDVEAVYALIAIDHSLDTELAAKLLKLVRNALASRCRFSVAHRAR